MIKYIIEELKKNKNYNNQFVRVFEVPGESFDLLPVPGFLHSALQTLSLQLALQQVKHCPLTCRYWTIF
jgi:hypothetical protein